MGRNALLRIMVVAAMAGSAVSLTGGSANAATGVFRSGDNVVVNAAAGRANNIMVSLSGSVVFIQDTADTLTAGTGCAVQVDGSVACSIDLIRASVVVNAGDGNDTITKTAAVRGELNGESGGDTINGGSTQGNTNVLNGGAGNDTVNGGPVSDLLVGGPGADTLRGGGGFDIVSYLESTSGVVVDFDNSADDGVGVEGDNVLTDVEAIYGSQFGDTITGSALNDTMLGSGGNDRLVGGAGNDTLQGDLVQSIGGVGSDTLIGGPGNDTLNGVDNIFGNDSLDGGANTDTCTADAGDPKSFCEA
ncbi:Ca2+-binding RTX toxin-like protein [Streptomyces umbrinus]|uniref:Ca2+-binding RTX toxin-like protein n=1 Tax=Streptomyces umbrinus TaxID=67370 RepID=A0ABU0SIE5_9ACTN|nr:calcium-binding protein [Streptomyces umbrinus]MDQ1023335.1 Ca2+-binding RTX toxin-like protein [Streptomyces umbrinus]